MKIIIIGINKINKIDIAKYIIEHNDELSIVPSFTSDEYYKNKISEDYIYYLNPNTIDLSYKNNAFLFIETKDYISKGITCDDFYNNDILCLSLENFNNIIDKELETNENIIIWVDTKFHGSENITNEINETKYVLQRLENYNYMYFLDESNELINEVIYKYINSNEEVRKLLREEYC